MGLGGMKYAWQRQTKDLAHKKADQYSSLILDNRGIGESDKPFHRYTTSEMAKDVVEVIDHIGWTGKRELHIIGISMGGMIAQEIVSCSHCLFPPQVHFSLHCGLCAVRFGSNAFRRNNMPYSRQNAKALHTCLRVLHRPVVTEQRDCVLIHIAFPFCIPCFA
jgi:predicted alpha/beta hydrolase